VEAWITNKEADILKNDLRNFVNSGYEDPLYFYSLL
jgi:hypothetical protein